MYPKLLGTRLLVVRSIADQNHPEFFPHRLCVSMTFEQGVIIGPRISNKSKVSRITIIEYLIQLTDSFTVRLKSSIGSGKSSINRSFQSSKGSRISGVKI
jgi:hypothetical protein